MKNIPILLNSEMVNAILQGKKTQTRRKVKMPSQYEHIGYAYTNHSLDHIKVVVMEEDDTEDGEEIYIIIEPKAKKGDVFWVRETWATQSKYDSKKPSQLPSQGTPIYYLANESLNKEFFVPELGKIRPSIFMPKWGCRLFLEVTDVRLERLDGISQEDAKGEGIKSRHLNKGSGKIFKRYFNYFTNDYTCLSSILSFKTLWQSIYGEGSWAENPYVWVYEFKIIEKPENFGK